MGRNAEADGSGEQVEFVPKSFENEEDETPVTMVFKRPTERRKRMILAKVLKARGSDGDFSYEKFVGVQEDALKDCLVSVKNYSRGGSKIENAEDFIERSETEFFVEAADYVMTLFSLTDDEKKDLSGSSSSTPRKTRAKAGRTTRSKKSANKEDVDMGVEQ